MKVKIKTGQGIITSCILSQNNESLHYFIFSLCRLVPGSQAGEKPKAVLIYLAGTPPSPTLLPL
jgi:hypothetical protein